MAEPQTPQSAEIRLLESLHSLKSVVGLSHNFYRYPARMTPELAREVTQQFTKAGDVILDPFMGGGTSIVEALAARRRAIGIDLNPLAVFVTAAKTTPLSTNDQDAIRQWAQELNLSEDTAAVEPSIVDEPRVKNLPAPTLPAFARALASVDTLPFPRQQRFARCVLLRLGQWAVDCKSIVPDSDAMKDRLLAYVEEMLTGLEELVSVAESYGTRKRELTGQRKLLLRSAVGAEDDPQLTGLRGQPSLVITSPPYPGVHVLYHRWQVAGRRETPAPYWFIGANDGHGSSYYTLGSRTPFGLENYFRTLITVYQSVRAFIRPDALVVQLVAFSDVDSQLPAFLHAMQLAGYREATPITANRSELWRHVPNRKWYNYLGPGPYEARELLLFHQPCADRDG